MIRTIFVSLFLCLFASAQMQAQCTTTNDPAVSIENLCVQSPGTYTVWINVENWGALHAWNLKFCIAAGKGISLANVTSLVTGQTVNFGPGSFNADFTLNYGPVGDCDNGPRQTGPIAELTFVVSTKASPGSCFDVGLCTTFGGSRAWECSGDFLLQHPVIGCSGGICLASGPPSTTIRGTIKAVNGTPLQGVEVANSINSTTVFTNAQGRYQFLNLPAGCASSVVITPSLQGPTTNGITMVDVDWILDYVNGFITLNCEEILAADVNENGIVSLIDAIALNDFVTNGPNLSFLSGFWRFFPAGTSIVCNPAGYSVSVPSSSITLSLGATLISGVDFTGSKTGDVTGNATSKTNPIATESSASFTPSLIEVPTFGPNPFSDFTTLRFGLEKASEVTVRVIDLTGKTLERRTLFLGEGNQELKLDGRTWPQGVLMYQLTIGTELHSGRFLHLN